MTMLVSFMDIDETNDIFFMAAVVFFMLKK